MDKRKAKTNQQKPLLFTNRVCFYLLAWFFDWEKRATQPHETMYLCRLNCECDNDVALYPFSSQEHQTATKIPVLGNRFLRMRTINISNGVLVSVWVLSAVGSHFIFLFFPRFFRFCVFISRTIRFVGERGSEWKRTAIHEFNLVPFHPFGQARDRVHGHKSTAACSTVQAQAHQQDTFHVLPV